MKLHRVALSLVALSVAVGAEEPRPSLPALAQRLKPGVVNVQAIQMEQRRQGDALDEFFDRFFGERGQERRRSLGSGFLYDAAGYVITNDHVVKDARDVRVKLADDREYRGDVVGRDPKTDLALVRLRGARDLPTVALGDSDRLQVGDWVMAIGNPFGLGNTVTVGIVSAKERVVGAGPYDDFIQTDASINPGNSGGPLFNMQGEVVGVNTAIITGGQGIGFAIPINLVKLVAEQLKERHRVTRGYIGIAVQEVTAELAQAFRLPRPEGALVSTVEPGGPAAEAGVRSGDVILRWSGKPIGQSNRLPLLVAETPPGRRATLELWREGRLVETGVLVAELADHEVARLPPPAAPKGLGLELQDIPTAVRSSHRFDRGAVVVRVDPDGRAAGVLATGDILLEIDRENVRSADEARRCIQANRGTVLLRVRRRDGLLFAALPPAR